MAKIFIDNGTLKIVNEGGYEYEKFMGINLKEQIKTKKIAVTLFIVFVLLLAITIYFTNFTSSDTDRDILLMIGTFFSLFFAWIFLVSSAKHQEKYYALESEYILAKIELEDEISAFKKS